MASFEVLPEENSEQSEESSEFLIFPHPPSSMEHIKDSFNMISMNSAVMMATPDLSPEEIHRWLKELLQENIQMKETLQKNNNVMHDQLGTVAAWHERMAETNSKHQIMLDEATQLGQKVQSEKEELLQKIKQMENMLKISSESQSYPQIGDELKGTLLQLHNEEKKVMQLTQKLEDERIEVACLKKLMEAQEDHIKTLSKIAEVPKEPESESGSAILCSSCYGEKGSIQQRASSDPQETLLMASCLEKYKEKNSLLETKQILEQLSIDYEKSVQQLLDEKTKEEQLTTMKEIEQRQHYKQLDMLTAKFLQVEQQLEAEQQKVANLKAELSTLKEDSEINSILKAQVDLYKADFEGEKEARYHFEKEVNELRRELKKLKNELDSKADSQTVFYGSNGSHHKDKMLQWKAKNMKDFRRHEISNKFKSREPALLACPSCMLKFAKQQDLENHVKTCIS